MSWPRKSQRAPDDSMFHQPDFADGLLTIDGTNANDVITLTESAGDLVVSLNGVETAFPLPLIDSVLVRALDGDDTITRLGGSSALAFTIFGQDGDDTITGSDAAEEIDGGRGSDTIIANGGNDLIYGRSGNDTLEGGAGVDEIHGNSGRDTIKGGSGDDTIYGGIALDTIRGGAGDDFIVGGLGDDRIFGQAGNDTIQGGGGNDIVDGGEDEDILSGQAGDDILIGGEGGDTINGGSGSDAIIGASLSIGEDTAQLELLRSEWASGKVYLERILNMRDGSGGSPLNAPTYLTDIVLADYEDDFLTGSSSRDYFWAHSTEVLDAASNETID